MYIYMFVWYVILSVKVSIFDDRLSCVHPVDELVLIVQSKTIWEGQVGLCNDGTIGAIEPCPLNLRVSAPVCPEHETIGRWGGGEGRDGRGGI